MGGFVLDPGYRASVELAAKDARAQVLDEIADDARSLCPVDRGQLRATITVHKAEGTVTVGTDHWQFVEYGTRYMNAEPFMRPALYRQR